MRVCILLFTILFSLMLLTKNAQAKVLPQAVKGGSKAVVTKSPGAGIIVTPRLRGDRRALVIYFANLQNAKSVSYALTYNTGIQPEGAIGSLTLGGGSSNATQELLFGTCSRNVCRYHTGVNNARLEVSHISKTGKKYIKRYKIRV